MSHYDDDRSRRTRSNRDRSYRDDYEDTVYDVNSKDTRIVRRRDDSSSSIEEIPRNGQLYRETVTRKSGHRPVRTRSDDDRYYDDRYYDDRYDDRSLVSRRRHDDDYTVASKPSRGRDYDDRRKLLQHYILFIF